MSNRRKTRMSRADLARLAADWDRARRIEALAIAAAQEQDDEDGDGR